jgi:hypothetical protein
VIGLVMLIAPGPIARLWLGSRGTIESKVLARTHGVRDIAVGAGMAWAVDRDEPVHAWATGAALSDAVDAGVTLAYWNSLPRIGRWLVLAIAVPSAVQMSVLAARTAR